MREFQELSRTIRVGIAVGAGLLASVSTAYLLIGLYLEWLMHRRFGGLDIWEIPLKLSLQTEDRQQTILLAAGTAILALSAVFAIAALRGPSSKYGDAVFAKRDKLVKEGYAARLLHDTKDERQKLDSEIVFAKFGPPKSKNATYNKLGRDAQKPHAMFIAPSGSGKTSGFVIPNVLRFNGSCVVLDVKGEIFKATGGRRAARADHLDHRWEEVIQVAKQLFDTPSTSAQGFLGGVEGMFCALAMLAIKRDRPYISEIYRLAKTTTQKGYETLVEEVGYARAADEFLSLASEEPKILRSILSVMNNSGLQLWRNPSVALATQGNDINFEDLRRRPASIYFSIAGKKVDEYKTLIRLFFLDLVNTIETHEPGEDEPFKVLILLDEFQRLGNLERIVEAFDTMRSIGGRLIVISQTISRLQKIYDHEGVRAMLVNAGTQMFAASEDPEVRGQDLVSSSHTNGPEKSVWCEPFFPMEQPHIERPMAVLRLAFETKIPVTHFDARSLYQTRSREALTSVSTLLKSLGRFLSRTQSRF